MRTRTAESLSQCHRTGKAGDNRIQKAFRLAQRDDENKHRLEERVEFDDRMAGLTRRVSAPAGLREKIVGLADRPRTRDWRTAPAILSAGVAILVMLGLAGFLFWNHLQNFEGKEAIAAILDRTETMSGVELEPRETEAGRLGDWFFMQYGLEHFSVPEEFAKLHTLGVRVFRQAGHPVAQIAIDARQMLFFIFRAEDFGIQLPANHQWRIVERDQWVGAVREDEGMCFMIGIAGDREDMRELLVSLEKNPVGVSRPPKSDPEEDKPSPSPVEIQ